MLVWDTFGVSREIILFTLMWVSSLAKDKNDITVTCTDSEQCVLPCQFQSDGKGARIMWYIKGSIVSCTRYGDTSFVIGSNSQVDSYKGRTGLFADQVLEGNAALKLQNITPHDQEKYFCVTMTDKHTGQSGVVSLIVKAPVRRVDIGFRNGGVTCSSKGLYPRPTLIWSIDPPPETGRLQNHTTISETQQGFYNIQSSLQLKETSPTNRNFICRVATDTNHRTAFLKQQASILACPATTVSIPCTLPLNRTAYNLTWTFEDQEQIVSITVTKRKLLVKVSERWEPLVSVDAQSTGDLTLDQVTTELQGTYSCEVNTPEETHTTHAAVIVQQDWQCEVLHFILGLGCFLMLFGAVLLFYFIKSKMYKGTRPCSREERLELKRTVVEGTEGSAAAERAFNPSSGQHHVLQEKTLETI